MGQNRFLNRLITDKKWLSFWIAGFLAFIWIVLRSGTNPKRLVYPCQQSAFPLASSWVMAVIAAFGGGLLLQKLLKGSIVLLSIVAAVWIFSSSSRPSKSTPKGNYPTWRSDNPTSRIYVFENIPVSPGSLAAGNASVPNSYLNDPGIDSLIIMMENNGTYFYKTQSKPDGIVGSNDIVLIKANFQWRGRLSTNTDRIKGVIWRILNHPDGFTGEIVVVDNGTEQIQPASYFCGFSDYANNSDDLQQSIVDVVNVFKSKGYKVDFFVWDNLNTTLVAEYSTSDMRNGYVYNSTTKVNYPKFRTTGGVYVSVKLGIWNASSATYDLNRLTIINMPVLKAHEMGGATVAVKNWVGIMNQAYADSWYGGYNQFHYNYIFHSYALPSRVMNEIWPKLNIVDATYIATRNNYEPGSPTVKTNTILSSTDPVAVSWYAAKYILQPVAVYPTRVNPDNLTSGYYGTNLDHWHKYFINNTSRTVTKDPQKISVYGNKDIGTHINDTSYPEAIMRAYPNPSINGRFNIVFDGPYLPNEIYLTSSSGHQLKKFLVQGNQMEIDLSRFSSGSYYLYFADGKLRQSITLVNLK